MGYKVLVDEVTVHQTINKLPQPDGSYIYQNGLGQTYYRDEVVPDDKMAEDWKEALESGEGPLAEALSKRFEVSSGDESDTGKRLGAPFAGYDDMEEDDVLNAMKMLPSAAISRIKEYEEQRDEPRERITTYNVGYGESAVDRQEGRVSSDPQEGDPDKASARISTREVPEEGPVVAGEGVTGTGDPQVPYGSRQDEEKGDIKGSGSPRRRGRRDRQPKPQEGGSDPSLAKANE